GVGGFGVAVDGDAVAEAAAEEVPDRLAEDLALDVPERGLDGGHRAAADRAEQAVAHGGGVHLGPEAVDMSGVLADEDVGEVVDGRLDDARPAGALADALDAFVGQDLDEEPAARAAE